METKCQLCERLALWYCQVTSFTDQYLPGTGNALSKKLTLSMLTLFIDITSIPREIMPYGKKTSLGMLHNIEELHFSSRELGKRQAKFTRNLTATPDSSVGKASYSD